MVCDGGVYSPQKNSSKILKIRQLNCYLRYSIAVINSLISYLFVQIAVINSKFSRFCWGPDRSNKFRSFFFRKHFLPLRYVLCPVKMNTYLIYILHEGLSIKYVRSNLAIFRHPPPNHVRPCSFSMWPPLPLNLFARTPNIFM